MLAGISTRQIAEKPSISYYTAETYRKNICAKLSLKGDKRALVTFPCPQSPVKNGDSEGTKDLCHRVPMKNRRL